MVSGSVTQPLPEVIVIEAIGLCEHCRLGTHYFLRFYADGRIAGLRDGVWESWGPSRPRGSTWAAALLGALRRLLGA